MVRIEGFRGLGGIVSLFMALCPDDVLLLVENGILFEGQRRSVTISVRQDLETLFHVEKIIRGSKSSSALPVVFRPDEFLAQPGRLSSYDHLTMQMAGCMTRMVEQLLGATLRESDPVIVSFVDLIGGIMISFTGADFGPRSDFPQDGLRSLLGCHAYSRIKNKLSLLFGVPPESDNIDLSVNYNRFCASLSSLIRDFLCSHCDGSKHWANLTSSRDPCRGCSIWGGLQSLVGHAVLLCLVDTDLQTLPIPQQPRAKLGPYLCRRLLHRLHARAHFQSYTENQPGSPDCYSTRDVHTDLCQLLGYIPTNAGQWHNVIGTSNGATSILPVTLEMTSPKGSRLVRYRILDGQFYDGRNYYKAITETAHVQPRPSATDSILQAHQAVYPSSIGVHSDCTLSLRPHHNSLNLRATISFPAQVIEISFYDMHLAYMATSVAHACAHDPNDVLAQPNSKNVIATGVEAPVASHGRTSLVLTHGVGEAQILAGTLGVPSLFQGESCLNCMMKDANENGLRLLIQS